MAKDYSKYSQEELIQYIEELNQQLKNKMYGLYWDKEITKENNSNILISNMPLLIERVNMQVNNNGDNHILINGENLFALIGLNFILSEKIDVIYIDPPYNTGNKDFIYNDKFVNEDDGYRHSKWLSFMEKRLLLSRNLLSQEGIIFISIDEHEVFQLKLLCDKIFGEVNYIENFIWIKNSIKNLSKTTSTNHEYILCYAKNKNYILDKGYFRVKKPGLDEVKDLLDRLYEKNATIDEAEKEINLFYKKHDGLKGISMYKKVDIKNNKFVLYRLSDISAPKAKGTGLTYNVYHPVTKQPCKVPSRGWAYSEEKMKELIENNLIYFYQDHNNVPAYKRYLDTVETEVVKSTFENFDEGKKELYKIFLSNDVFENSKPHSLMKHLISMINKKDVTILDYFAGSGTTGQAVLELNAEDGGNRKFILCTNNENKICDNVTYPRLKTIITGQRNNGTVYSDGVQGNLHYFDIQLLETDKNTDQTKYMMVEFIDSYLCILENTYQLREKNSYSSCYYSDTKELYIYNDYYSEEKINIFKKMISKETTKNKVIYMFSTDNIVDKDIFADISRIEVKPIPAKIYEIYKEIVEEIKRG